MHLDVLLKLRQVENNVLRLVVQPMHVDVLSKNETDRDQRLTVTHEAHAIAHANESV